MERETIEVDVVYVGAGPAALSSALHLKQIVKDKKALEEENNKVVEEEDKQDKE